MISSPVPLFLNSTGTKLGQFVGFKIISVCRGCLPAMAVPLSKSLPTSLFFPFHASIFFSVLFPVWRMKLKNMRSVLLSDLPLHRKGPFRVVFPVFLNHVTIRAGPSV